MFCQLPLPSILENGNYYLTVEEDSKEAFQITCEFHLKNNVRYSLKFVEATFKPDDLVTAEEVYYLNTQILRPFFSGPYQIIEKTECRLSN